MIEVVNLKKSFGDNQVLKGISISINKGEKVVVIGPSGSGKSTFLRCLNCMEGPTSGNIFFNGVDIDTAHRFWRLSLARYLGTDDEKVITETENKAKVIGYMRLLRRCLRRDTDEKTINHYETQLKEALDKVDTLVF